MPNKLPLVTLSLYLRLSCLELFFSSSHHRLHSIHRYATSIWSLLVRINFIITISIHLSTWISIGLPLSRWDKSYHYPSLLLNLYWTLGQVYCLHPLLLTAHLGHPPIGWHHPHLTIYSGIPDDKRDEDKEKGWPKVIYWAFQGQGFIVRGIPLDCDRWDNVP